MATLDRAVKELQSERSRLEKDLQRVDAALTALSSLNSRGRGRGPLDPATEAVSCVP